MNKTALVTGGKGFIGSEVVRALSANGWKVISAVREATNENEIEIDLSNPNFSEKLLKLKKPDAIIHFGAKIGFNGESLDELYPTNVESTSALLKLAQQWGAFFLFASAAQIAGIDNTNINQETPDQPSSPYMESKLLAENLIKSANVQSTILRIGGVYGLNGPKHLGLNRAISNIQHSKAPVQIGKGSARRNYLYVKDLAEVVAQATLNRTVGTHLVAGKDILSIAEMLNLLCKTFKLGLLPVIKGGVEGKDQIIIPSKKIQSYFSFEDAIKDIFKESKL